MYTPKYTLEEILYPKASPFNEGHLSVSEVHKIWYAEFGNPKGVPVIFIHGGPGAGTFENDMRFFDPEYYHIILFDQRGSGKSLPFGELKDNNTQNLIEDIDKLRKHLKVDKWFVFGGSWGSALAMLYGETYPENCHGFVLRGIYLGTKPEYEQLWYGMKDIFPEYWEEMANYIPESERDDLIKAYYKRLTSSDPKIQEEAAGYFMKYDALASYLFDSREKVSRILLDEDKLVLGCSKLFTHYSINKFFLSHDQIIKNIGKINHLPAYIIHGRYDVICRAEQAYRLHKNWPNSHLTFVQDAGHASTEIGIAKALVDATNKMKKVL
ncbi:MAG: prolyl aminopeptidase [Alphaproteobacteria bacterium 33-17]|nr:MAG: prolyl aminopeptidase [Alphaproteobacteria bacterium 33-17]